MVNEYDRSLHVAGGYRVMETPPRELDEARIDAAISQIIDAARQDAPVVLQPEQPRRLEFPELSPAEEQSAAQRGVAALLRQKWAEFSGAA